MGSHLGLIKYCFLVNEAFLLNIHMKLFLPIPNYATKQQFYVVAEDMYVHNIITDTIDGGFQKQLDRGLTKLDQTCLQYR